MVNGKIQYHHHSKCPVVKQQQSAAGEGSSTKRGGAAMSAAGSAKPQGGRGGGRYGPHGGRGGGVVVESPLRVRGMTTHYRKVSFPSKNELITDGNSVSRDTGAYATRSAPAVALRRFKSASSARQSCRNPAAARPQSVQADVALLRRQAVTLASCGPQRGQGLYARLVLCPLASGSERKGPESKGSGVKTCHKH